jgi:hypothetical protein
MFVWPKTISIYAISRYVTGKLAVSPRDDGVGLAAPQVGVNVRLMVFNPYGREKPGNETILVNPREACTKWTGHFLGAYLNAACGFLCRNYICESR